MDKEDEHAKKSEVIDNRWSLLVEEFRSRHAEILHYQTETKQIIFWSVAATGALWAWVVENKASTDAQIFMNFVVFLPLVVVIYSGLRWRLLEHFIETNSKYIRVHIEKHFPMNEQGWEGYLWLEQNNDNKSSKTLISKRKLQKLNRKLSIILWFLLVIFNAMGIVINFYTRFSM